MFQAYDPSTNPLNGNEWSFPLFEIIHIASFAVAVGTIAIVDVRLLRAGMRRFTAAELVQATQFWTFPALMIALLSGAILVTTDPLNYFHNPAFQLKMVFFAIAIAFHYAVLGRVARAKEPGWFGSIAGALSIASWLSVVFTGIFYAFL